MEFTRRLLVEYKDRLDQIMAEHSRSHALLKQNRSVNVEDSVVDSHCEEARAGAQENSWLAPDKSPAGKNKNTGRHEDGQKATAKKGHKQATSGGGSCDEGSSEDVSGGQTTDAEERKPAAAEKKKTPECRLSNEGQAAGGCSAQAASPFAAKQAAPHVCCFPQAEDTGPCRVELNAIETSEGPGGAAFKTCLVDETILGDATRIQDQSCFMGNETYTLDALAQYRKRRARRRTGRRIQKRRHEDLPEFPDPVKRMRTDEVRSYLLEHYQMLSNSIRGEASFENADRDPGAALPNYEDELGRMKETGRRKRRKMRRLKEKLKEIDLLKEKLREIEAQKDQEKAAEMERMAELNRRRMEEESAKRTEELERIKREGLEATKKIEEEMRKFMGFKDEILAQSKIIADHRLEQQAVGGCEKKRRAQEKVAASCESKVFADKSRMSRKGNINDFFREAKKEHIEKINQTMLSRTWISEKGDASKAKATFNSTVHKPRQPIINVDFIKPHSLYKQSIDVQNTQDDAKNYVPKTFVPFYASEDEFEAEEKKFANASFTKDPRLLYTVRKQNHNEIRAFFGNQRDIDVETIFSKVENVTNNSPNKFTRRS